MGQTWERMMLMKARGVAGDPALAAEFLEMIPAVPLTRVRSEQMSGREIAAMKARLETEVVKAGEIESNVKLGRAAFVKLNSLSQTQQLLHAGRLPFLHGAQTLPVLQSWRQYKLLAVEEAESLATAYCSYATSNIVCKWSITCKRTLSPPIARPARAWPR